ncbi:MAG: hypothetical protein P8X60_10240, partial [Robiginitalea sp.]
MGFLLITLSSAVKGQHNDSPEPREEHSMVERDSTDSHGGPSSLKELFGLGTVSGHFRNFFMNTANQGDLKDYYANAIGGAIRFRTHTFYGFELGVAGIFTFKVFSNDLNEPDPTTGRVS